MKLGRSFWANDAKVAEVGREAAVQAFRDRIKTDVALRAWLGKLSGKRLLCHCRPFQACHADPILEAFKEMYPNDLSSQDHPAAPGGYR